MRVITATFLGFLVSTAAGCGPRMPALDLTGGDEPPPSGPRDAARPDAAAQAPADAASRAEVAPDARPEARADAGLEARADATPEARADAAPEARADAAPEARADAAPEARADAAPPDADAADAPSEVAAEARPPVDAAGARAPRAGELRIDELLVDPDGNDLGHEWIEVVNLASDPLLLADLHVADAATDVAVDGGVLAPGGRLVLGQSIDRAHNGDAPVDVAYGTRIALNNDADRVAVCLGACATGVTLDAFAWSSSFGAEYAGRAVVIAPDGRTTCPAAEAYGAGGDHGSPGRANPPCAAPDAGAPGS